jgi:soluble lytic murein transglycosylase
LAYNAGLSRLRGWERSSGSLAEDLLLEAATIEESREYLRKILVSIVKYTSLYAAQDPRSAVLSFFGLPDTPLAEKPGESRRNPSLSIE